MFCLSADLLPNYRLLGLTNANIKLLIKKFVIFNQSAWCQDSNRSFISFTKNEGFGSANHWNSENGSSVWFAKTNWALSAVGRCFILILIYHKRPETKGNRQKTKDKNIDIMGTDFRQIALRGEINVYLFVWHYPNCASFKSTYHMPSPSPSSLPLPLIWHLEIRWSQWSTYLATKNMN